MISNEPDLAELVGDKSIGFCYNRKERTFLFVGY